MIIYYRLIAISILHLYDLSQTTKTNILPLLPSCYYTILQDRFPLSSATFHTMATLPLVSDLPSLPTSSLTAVLDLLFEPSPPLHTLSTPLLQSTPFSSYPALIVAVQTQLTTLASSTSPDAMTTLSEILCAHPRLGEKKVDSEQSRAEQAQLNKGGQEEAEALAKLNQEYEEAFPGLRYV